MKVLQIITFLFATTAFAHTHLVSSDPKAGVMLKRAPQMVMLTFSESVEPKFSKVEVSDSAGKQVDSGKVEGGGERNEMLHTPLKALSPGKYHVKWRATSKDTHKIKGEFDFTVDATGK